MRDMDFVPRSREGFGEVITMARAKNVPVFFITGDYDNLLSWVRQKGIDSLVTVLKCDATAIKTAARSLDKPTLYLLKNATILKKWSYADYNTAIPSIAELPEQK
jgi:hypothetical protein